MKHQWTDGIAVFGEPMLNAVEQMKHAMKFGPVVGAALMADHHLGYAVPVGVAPTDAGRSGDGRG